MSFLENLKIKTKILSIIIPICFLGVAGAFILSSSMRDVDSRYSTFVNNDTGSLLLVARSSQRLMALGYNAYQIIAYDPQTPEFLTAKADYDDNASQMVQRMNEAVKLSPERAGIFLPIRDRYLEVIKLTSKAVDLGMKSQDTEAFAQLKIADKLIAAAAKDVRELIVKGGKHISDQSEIITHQTTSTIYYTLGGLFVAFAVAIVAAMVICTRGITDPIEKLRARMVSLAQGETQAAIDGAGRGDEVGQMAVAVAVFRDNALERQKLAAEAEASRGLSERERAEREAQSAKDAADTKFAVDELATGLLRLSGGDVTYRIHSSFVGSLDDLRMNFNDSVAKLQQALMAVKQNAGGIDAGANEIRSASDDLSRRTEQQAASVEETAAALEQITTTVKDSTRRAEEAGILVSRTRSGAEQSGAVVRKAVAAMQGIEKSSSEISNIIGVIDEIAFQTNLLALNAGVEAARAGEAGKGFAVVAQEVRELAQRSASAAKDIKALIVSSGQQVQEGVTLVAETGSALEAIVGEVQEINRHVSAIVEAAREQSVGLQEINTAVNAMDQGTQQNAAMVEQTTAASHSLAKEAAELNELLSRFKLDERGAPMQSVDRKPARVASQSVESPVRKLTQTLRGAFGGSAAVKKAQWENF